jgi:hypothetical protein
MRFRVVCDLITHTRFENEFPTVSNLCVQLAFQTKEDVPFDAPVVRSIASCVLDHADTNGTEVTRAPVRNAAFAFVFRPLDASPICGSEWNV